VLVGGGWRVRRSELELSIAWVRRLLPDDDQLVVIGSQSVLGAFDEVLLPDDARLSMEVDVLPLRDPDEQKADLIDVMLGRDSPFHEQFGIYVDGVAPRGHCGERGASRNNVRQGEAPCPCRPATADAG
jgi:hypothetical protein